MRTPIFRTAAAASIGGKVSVPHLNAQFTSQADKEFTWFSLGASLPVLSMDTEVAARQIVGVMRRRRAELTLTPLGQIVARGAGIFPELTGTLLHLTRQLLPAPGGLGGEPVAGGELRPAFNGRAFDRLTALGRSAARQLNQVSPTRQAES